MAQEHPAGRDTQGASGEHVAPLHYLMNGCPQGTREDRAVAQRYGDRREHKRQRTMHAHKGKPAKAEGEEVEQYEGKPELRERKKEVLQCSYHSISSGSRQSNHRKETAKDHAEEQPQGSEPQGHRQPLRQKGFHGVSLGPRVAQMASKKISHPRGVSPGHRHIKAQRLADLLHGGGIRVDPCHNSRGVTRKYIENKKCNGCRYQEHEDCVGNYGSNPAKRQQRVR